ncbi:unnamed protein product [Ambrosiozyma monospora]|uniref:Unnamed protein product n=1 Tax=Ambrosiozyma monospora TaxID=43982 RepID=A0ACB5UCM4_AMBMO|nr:unnamed protein product [Ambrosiozyma monospora]
MLTKTSLMMLLASLVAQTNSIPVADADPEAAAGSAAQLYGQCGGSMWTGPTQCASGASCYSINPYYYQCTPGSGNAVATAASTATAVAHNNNNSSGSLSSGSTVPHLQVLQERVVQAPHLQE